ncbi:MAG: hypothetical protein H9W81_04290 [Enterococcus sp.]|nr:hypothetical protein [Enterococcus sp.]
MRKPQFPETLKAITGTAVIFVLMGAFGVAGFFLEQCDSRLSSNTVQSLCSDGNMLLADFSRYFLVSGVVIVSAFLASRLAGRIVENGSVKEPIVTLCVNALVIAFGFSGAMEMVITEFISLFI